MANQHKHPLRGIRGIDDRLWEDLDTYAKAAGSDRSKVTRELWEWYIGRPGAELPEQPTAGAVLRQLGATHGQVGRVLNQAVYGNVDGPGDERTPVSDDLARAVEGAFDDPERPASSEEKTA